MMILFIIFDIEIALLLATPILIQWSVMMSMFVTFFYYHFIYSTFMWMNWSISKLKTMNYLFMTSWTIILMNMIIMMSTWTLLSMNNPLNLSLVIMMTAIILSILTSLTMSTWYAMMMFLIYVGGMMEMFSYFVSLSSNDSMMMKTKLHFIIFAFIMIKTSKLQLLIPQYCSMEMNKLYMHNNITIMLLMTMILLIMMFIIIKMVSTDNGPLRGFHKM